MADEFWPAIRAQLKELESAKSADDVLATLSRERCPLKDWAGSAGAGFFAGSGGDDTVWEALTEAGWRIIWSEASYYYAMRAPDGRSAITYVEGDIYRGDRRAGWTGRPARGVDGVSYTEELEWVPTADVRVGDRLAFLLSDAHAFCAVTGWSDRLLKLSRYSPKLRDVTHRTFEVAGAPWWAQPSDMRVHGLAGRALIVKREER